MPQKPRKSLMNLLEAARKKAERKQWLAEERNRNIERLQVEAKENSLRTAILADSVQTFENLIRKVREFKKHQRKQNEWIQFLECDNIPDTNFPSQVRNFFYKWQTIMDDHCKTEVNWWLKCDDRSLLTQNIIFGDQRRYAVKWCREPTGKFYDQTTRLVVRVYNSLMNSLRRKKMSPEAFNDLITVRNDLREMVFKFLDALMFEVVAHVEREMNSISPITLQYSYKSPDFVNYIWSFKETALPENYVKLKLIKMGPLQMNVKISNQLDLEKTAVRGLWFKHDFFTDLSPSFNPPCEIAFETLDVTTNSERQVRKFMFDVHLEQMKKTRQDWEEKMEKLKLEEEDSKAMKAPKKSKEGGDKGKNKMNNTLSKMILKMEEEEPLVVDETTYVDVEQEYLTYEDNLLENENKRSVPENLELSEHEVNLREFHIINGVFRLECFERPSQTVEINPTLFLRLDETLNKLILQDFRQDFQEPQKVQATKEPRKSIVEKTFWLAREKALADLIKVEVKLTEKVFWWSSPIVCRWEPYEESEEFSKLDQKVQDFHNNYETFIKKESEKLFAAPDPRHFRKTIRIKEVDLTKPEYDTKLSELFRNYIVPIMPLEFKLFDDRMTEFEEKQRDWKEILRLRNDLTQMDIQQSVINLHELFDETRMKFDVRSITIDEFNKLFDERSFTPRNLFPESQQNLIEILENDEIVKSVKEAVEKLQNQQKKDDDDIDIGCKKPLKNEPLALSELLKSVENVKESLKPFFKDIEIDLSVERKTLNSIHVESFKVDDKGSLAEASEGPTKNSEKKTAKYKGKWSTKYFSEESYDVDTKTVTFFTGRLGIFAFATKKYCNLPLKSWEIFPVIESKTSRFVMMKVDTEHFSVEFKITVDGFTFEVKGMKGVQLVTFYKIKKPIKIFDLKKLMTSLNLNIFPEVDACHYVKNHCEKHKPMEFHTYKSMALFSLSHYFKSSIWNSKSHRRVTIFESRTLHKNTFKSLMVTPLRAACVNVEAMKTETGFTELEYVLIPLDQEFLPDLLSFLNVEVDKKEHRINLNNFMTLWFAHALLVNIQPLSFTK